MNYLKLDRIEKHVSGIVNCMSRGAACLDRGGKVTEPKASTMVSTPLDMIVAEGASSGCVSQSTGATS